MTETEAERVLSAIAAEFGPVFDPETEFTAPQLATRVGITATSARDRLERDVAAGKLTRRVARRPGQSPVVAYRRSES